MRVLLVEDNQRLNRALALSLREEGYAVDCAFDGIEGQEFAEAAPYDAIILDVLLPRKDGFDVCRDLRRQKVTMPILLLTARDSVADRVRGLDSGADDYLVKPFALQELLARMRALLRRGGPQSGTVLCVADLSADPATHHVERAGRRLALTAREFSLLEYFLRRPNQIVTRSQIEEHLWSYDVITASNVVDAAVRRLRRKIDDPFEVKLLETLYGLGYRLRDSGDVPVPSLFFSLRLRFMLWYGAILALILVACSGAVYLTEQRSLLARIDSHLAVRVQQWAGDYNARTGRFATKYDPDSGQGTEVVLLLTPEGQVVQSFSAGRLSGVKVPWDQTVRMLAGVARAGTSSVHEYGLLQTTPAAPSKGGITPLTVNRPAIYRMSGMPLRVGNRVAALLVVGIRSDVAQQLTTLARTLETVVPLVLILCVGSGYWLVNRALRPIRLITRTANQISATDLSKRLNLRCRDELGQLGATLDHMFSRLEAAVERQRQFTADAGHELRTPLAVIDLEATQALAHRRTADQYRQAIAGMQDETGRMTRLVNDLLTLARADSGDVAICRTDVDLAAVVLDVLERLEPLARLNEMTVTIETLPDARVWGDQEALTRMLTNIIENALKHGAGRGTQVRLSGGLERDQDSPGLWLRVVDDGPGIASEHLPRVCERFYRVDPARTHTRHEEGDASATGSGLGLAITQEIIRNHGGRLGISLAENNGVVVDIWLPTSGSGGV